VTATGPALAQPVDAAARAVAAIGLMSVGIIHALEIQGNLGSTVWLTVAFSVLAGIAPVAGLCLLVRPSRASWIAGGVICLATAIGYVLTRSVGLPGDTGDIGNWLEPLGITSLIIEGIIVVIAVLALMDSNLDQRPWPTAASV
jgi:hypothetical protein